MSDMMIKGNNIYYNGNLIYTKKNGDSVSVYDGEVWINGVCVARPTILQKIRARTMFDLCLMIILAVLIVILLN